MRQVRIGNMDEFGVGIPIVANRKERRAAKKQNKGIARRPVTDDSASLAPESTRLFDAALHRHEAGDMVGTELLCRQVLAIDARHSDSLHLLGVIAVQTGHAESAVELIGQAIRLKGDDPSYHNDMGNVLKAQGKLDDALASYQRALAIAPDFALVHYNLAIVFEAQSKLDDAVASYRRALAIDPHSAEAHNNLGNALKEQGKLDEAMTSYRHALAVAPDYAVAHNNMGIALYARGQLEDAIASYHRALASAPDYAEAHNNLGNALKDQDKVDEAVAHYERALGNKPDYALAHYNLAIAREAQGKLEDAVTSYQRALAITPNYAAAYNNLGNVLKDQGKLADAAACYERALAITPDDAEARSNLLFCMNYDSELGADRIAAESRRWNEIHALPHQPTGVGYANERAPERKLRIGYVSPDFRRHSVSYFLEPLLRAHDSEAAEIFCYAQIRHPDEVTYRLRALADHWLVTVGMTDDALAQRIRDDRIDILVDLAGHTASSRLTVFARKPAPVQVTWLGYPNTTGLSAIDYRLVDAITDPADDPGSWASERLVRLPNGFLCYQPPTGAPPPQPPPSLASGFITFGSFNNPAKLSPATLDTWAVLLGRLPTAQLLLKGPSFTDASTRALFHARFAERGIAAERITLLGHEPGVVDHLAVYHRIDIALDPFPYNGTTTTCEALWMGVPVVTLRGRRHAGRVGASLLTRLGLDDLIAGDREDYVERAAALAADSARLARLRQDLRASFAASSLCDAPGFARKIEAAYREMWRHWCTQTSAEPSQAASPSSDSRHG